MKRFFFWNKTEKDEAAAKGRDLADASGLITGDPKVDDASLRILLDSIAEVTSSMDLDEVLQAIVAKSLAVTQAERAIVLLGSDPEQMQIRIARDRDGTALEGDLQFSRSIVRRAIEEDQAVRSVVQSDREALELGRSVYDLKLRAVMCAPMKSKDRRVGVIYVDSRGARREFSSRDLALFGALSQQLAIAVENARLYADSLAKVALEKDVEFAERIQRHMLAPVPQRHDGFEFALHYSASGKTSGDTFDFLPLRSGKVAILIGDVSGHGIGPALLSHAAQAAVRSYLEVLDDMGEVIVRLNNRLTASVEAGNFMSMLLVELDGRGARFRYVNAGHPELVVVRKDRVESFGKTGMVMGVVSDQPYATGGPVPIEPGDVLFLYTDGVVEARNAEGQLFGVERLHRLLADLRTLPCSDILARVEDATRAHAGTKGQEDDVTMIATRFLGEAGAAAGR